MQHNIANSAREYVAKFLYALRRYGVWEALLLTRDFFKRRWAALRGLDANALYEGRRYPSFPPDVFSLERPVDLSAVKDVGQELFSPAVVLHCHYVELLPEIMPWLGNLPKDTHYYVSTDSTAKKRAIEAVLACLEPFALDVRVLPNRGFDIAPFYVGSRDVLLKYDIVLKIHTKASPQIQSAEVSAWKKLCYESLLGSKEQVFAIQKYFAENTNMGIIAPRNYHKPASGRNYYFMQQLLSHYGITLPRDTAIDFPAGSMFWCRTKALKPWLDLDLSFDDFEDSATSLRNGTLAHALERLVFFGCGIEGMRWGRVSPVEDGTKIAIKYNLSHVNALMR